MRTTTVLFTVLGLGLATLFSATSTARAQNNTSETFTLESTSIAFSVGVSWGHGVLESALKSQNGVELVLSTTGQGVRLSLAQGGLDVRLPR